jgi:hypothetical protein
VTNTRICQRCGGTYQPTSPGQKYCGKQKVKGTCSWHVAQEITRRYLKENPAKRAQYSATFMTRLKQDPQRYEAWLQKSRDKNLRVHGLTREQYGTQLAAQNGTCGICFQPHGRALCGRSKDLAVDHDHETGALRGLLCDDCNIGLGLFHDDPQRLMNAALYIIKHKDVPVITKMIETRKRMFGSLYLEDD